MTVTTTPTWLMMKKMLMMPMDMEYRNILKAVGIPMLLA